MAPRSQLILLLVAAVCAVPPAPPSLHGLGLISTLPDVRRMNVSQEEYTKMFGVYLTRLRRRGQNSSYDRRRLYAFKHSGGSSRWRHSRHNLRFTGKVRGGVESATLRMMVEATPEGGTLSLSVFQVLPASGRRLLGSLSLDPLFLPRWTDLDVTSALFTPDLHFQVECTNCVVGISEPFLNVLARRSPKRMKRENHYRTDCFERHKKQKCCRHKMQVVFKDLPGYEFILQPYDFDAGFCKGGCPYRYNPANHHASLQSLIWRQKKGAAPKPCCAPSKLDHLEIIHLDENDNTKLKVATWTNMKVIECACF